MPDIDPLGPWAAGEMITGIMEKELDMRGSNFNLTIVQQCPHLELVLEALQRLW